MQKLKYKKIRENDFMTLLENRKMSFKLRTYIYNTCNWKKKQYSELIKYLNK